jgi:ferric enterobactin receptor
MKRKLLACFLIWFGCHFMVAQKTPIKEINLKEYFNYQTLDNVFELLKSKHGFKITYKLEEVKDIRFSYNFSSPITEDLVIENCLRETPLSFLRASDGTYTIFDKRKVVEAKAAEESMRYKGASKKKGFVLTGIVKDSKTGEPLPFVNIVIQGKTLGATTNVDGYFTLLNVPNDTVGLVVSYIGYKEKLHYLTPETPLSNLLIELESQQQFLDEVTVTAEHQELLRASEKISMFKLTPAKIQSLPSVGEKDIFRAFQLMPGVSAANENSSGLYVRGGTPDQTLTLYDGFNVYHVEHLFGFFSAFNPNAIKDVQLYKGGFESKFGGRISSVAEITGKEGNSKETNLGLNAGFLAVNAFAEIPIGDKFTSIFSVRRSFQTPLYTALFQKFGGGGNTAPQRQAAQGGRSRFGGNQQNTTVASYFYDVNGKFTYKPTVNDVVTLSVYNGEDNLDNSRASTPGGFRGGTFSFNITDLTNWGNIGSSLKWSHKFSPRLYMNNLVSYSTYFSNRDRSQDGSITDAAGNVRSIKSGTLESNDLKDFSYKSDFEYQLNKVNKIEFGTWITHNQINYSYSQNDTISIINRNTNGNILQFYAQDKVALLKNLEANVGVRYNYFTPTSQSYVEPRLSLVYQLSKQLKLKGAYGQYHQFTKRVIREDILQGSRDFWVLADNDKLPVAAATHYIVGGSYETPNWLFDVEAYQKDLTGLTEYSLRVRPIRQQGGGGATPTINFSENFFQGVGKSRGIDFLLQKKYGKLTGWLGYSLAEVRYNFPAFGAADFYANQDVRHEFKAVGIYKLGNWDVSATWIFASPRPYTAPEGGYQTTLLDGSSKDFINASGKNELRLPYYHRLDIAATYNWKRASLGFSIFNLYDRSNTWYKEFQIQSNQIIETNVNYLGITPNISYAWRLR